MPIENTSPTTLHPAELAAAVGVTATSPTFEFRDVYGVTYTGSAAHLALSALARRDSTARLYRRDPVARGAVRVTAAQLIDWFTSPYVDAGHAAEFAALTPMRVCELVAYLASQRGVDLLHVGPESLRYYTDHLLHDPVPSVEHPLPRLIDKPSRSLEGGEGNPRHRLQVVAAAADGQDEVLVKLDIEAHETISWDVVAAIPIPLAEINALLMAPDYLLGDYLSDNRELIDEYLVYRDSRAHEPVTVNATLASPTAALTYDQALKQRVGLELYFVGPDRDTALATTPYTRRTQAEQAATSEDRIFTTGVEVDADTLRHAA